VCTFLAVNILLAQYILWLEYKLTKFENVSKVQRVLGYKIFQNLWYRLRLMWKYSVGSSRVTRCPWILN